MLINIRNVKIFCHADDQLFLTAWINRYRHTYANIHFEIIAFDDLNDALPVFGLEQIQRLRVEFQSDFGILNVLNEDYQQIYQSLGNYALYKANIELEKIHQSEHKHKTKSFFVIFFV